MSLEPNFELTDTTKVNRYGVTLRQIRAIKDIPRRGITKGDLGGWVEKLRHDSGGARVSGDAWVSGNAEVYGNAEVSGNAWVSGDAQVYGNALVYGNARVSGDARVSGNADIEKTWHYIVVSPIGSENVCATIARTKGGGHQLTVGCWTDGSLGTLMKEVKLRRKVERKWTSASEVQQAQWMAEYAALKKLGKVTVTRWAESEDAS